VYTSTSSIPPSFIVCATYSLATVNDARPAAQRRARTRRSAAPSSYLLHELSHLRSLLTAAREKLAVEKERADSLKGEHFKLSQELRRALDQVAAERRATAGKLSSAGAALASDHAASLRRLEALNKIKLERAKATGLAQLVLDRLVDLRSERDQALSGFPPVQRGAERLAEGGCRAPRAAIEGSRPRRNPHTPGVSGHLCRAKFPLAAWNGAS
jgi:hypothetical protein